MSHDVVEPTTTSAGTPAAQPDAASTPRSATLTSAAAAGGYEAQRAALSPRLQRRKNAPAPANTGWTAIVRANFAAWDKNSDGWISLDEINEVMRDSSVTGAQAAAAAALHAYIEGLEELSNDEVGDENDGVTLADLTAYERGNAAGNNPEDAAGADGMHGAGQGRIRTAGGLRRRFRNAGNAANNELFANGVPSLNALRQGFIGDCYFLAAIGGMINRNPGDVVAMFRRNLQGNQVTSYTVTFPQRSLGSVTVSPPTDGEIARYSSAGNDGLWLIVLEKAYSQARAGASADIHDEIGEGGSLSSGVEAVTGSSTDTDDLWATSLNTTRRKLNEALNGRNKKIVTASIMSENDLHLPDGHAYTVLAWDGSWITLRNPWGRNPTEVPARADGFRDLGSGRFKMTIEKFDDIFSQITYQE